MVVIVPTNLAPLVFCRKYNQNVKYNVKIYINKQIVQSGIYVVTSIIIYIYIGYSYACG